MFGRTATPGIDRTRRCGSLHASKNYSDSLDEEFPDVMESWASRLHPDDRERIFQAVTEHFQHRIPYDVEYRLRTKSGEYRWFNARGQGIWNEQGQIERMSGTLA